MTRLDQLETPRLLLDLDRLERNAARMRERCAALGVSLIIGGPYNSGILATGVKGAGPFYYNYEPAPPEIIERVRRIETICDRFAVPLAAAAMQFPLAHPQVASVIPGMVNAAEAAKARDNLTRPIPAAFWDALRRDGLLYPAAPTPNT